MCLLAVALFGCPSKNPTPTPPQGRSGSAAQTLTDAQVTDINNRGLGLMGQFAYADAAKAFEEVVSARPELDDARMNLAIATFNRQLDGDEASAIEMAQQVLKTSPDNARAHYCLGLLLYRAGELDAATEHYKKAAELRPNDAYAVYSYGQSLEQQGKLEDSLTYYARAIELDPHLRSSYLRASQVNRRLGNDARADELLDTFNRLETNPQSRVLEAKYMRMGALSEAVTLDTSAHEPVPMPEGAVFTASQLLVRDGETLPFRVFEHGESASVTACDINGDGALDLFLADALTGDAGVRNAVLLGDASGGFALAADHPLADVPDVTAALWGDIDNDGNVDVYLCRRGPNHLWMQTSPGTWEEQGGKFGAAGGDHNTVDGAMIDADHDGDLDVLLINADGPNELLNNNRDGTFRPIGTDTGIAGDGRPSRSWIAYDFDMRRDLDLLIVKESVPNELFMNDRGWAYRHDDRFAELLSQKIDAATAADVDADGQVEIYILSKEDGISQWQPDDNGNWRKTNHTEVPKEIGPVPAMIAVIDVDGDGTLDCVHSTAHGWQAIHLGTNFGTSMFDMQEQSEHTIAGLAPVASSDGKGYAIVGVRNGAEPVIWKPGKARHEFVAMSLSGAEDPGQSMRSNASGIGTRIAARVGDQWTVVQNIRSTSGPGQSLQPVMIGLNGHDAIDFVQLDWPDGVFQTELSIAPQSGAAMKIAETQRQTSSCPILFAWDGEKFAFVTDLLGVGGMGYMVAPGEYAPPRPWERLLLPDGVLQPKDGMFVIKLAEPMEEACYLDAVHLNAVDLPPGWMVALDERMGIMDPQPTGELFFYRKESEVQPIAATNDRGDDVLATVNDADFIAAPVGKHDARFIGRLEHENIITLTFPQAIDAGESDPVLLIDGWVEYPYSQTMFAAWQANAAYEAPSLEARSANGEWQMVYEQFGYPAGMPRQMSLPIDCSRLPAGATQLRLRTNQEIYWDRIAVVYAKPCPEASVTKLAPAASSLREVGYPKRTTAAQRLPSYDYANCAPYYDMRRMKGMYTAVGPVEPLIAEMDGAMAIFGPGEEVEAEFVAPAAPVANGWTRVFVLDSYGWCKDMDLYTKDGETVGPLPNVENPTAYRDSLHRAFNTRYLSGP